jgi:hypothetical protein
MSDLLKVVPRPYDFGTGPSRPEWIAYVRESDLRRAVERSVELGKPVLRVPRYTRTGERVSEVMGRLPPGLREAYERKHGQGTAIHRAYLGPGAIITPIERVAEPEPAWQFPKHEQK